MVMMMMMMVVVVTKNTEKTPRRRIVLCDPPPRAEPVRRREGGDRPEGSPGVGVGYPGCLRAADLRPDHGRCPMHAGGNEP